ncbi:MAG TPA: histidinol dehydrogenase, partial [Campylobacterales bacterium]|nr:histidinol dehydrogenase [Campylobacterales bacterium]
MDIDSVSLTVSTIINEIKTDKNKALFAHISKFDNWTPKSDNDLEISQDSMKKAYKNITTELKEALRLAYKRI